MTWQVSPWQASLQAAFVSIWGAEGSPIPRLDLNFTSGSLDPRITFSRGSLATLTNAAGNVAYAPHNLLTYSEDLTNAVWAKSSTSTSLSASSSPTGGSAYILVENSSTIDHRISSSATVVVGVTYTTSVYLKAAGRTAVKLYSNMQGGTKSFVVDLTTGSISSSSMPSTPVSTSVGGGWWRVSYTEVADVTSAIGVYVVLMSSGLETYTGDGTSGVYVWGAQLNIGPLQPYYPTTASAYHGPRFTYDPITHASLGLLIEEQRTNAFLWSNDISNAWWTLTGATAVGGNVAPDGTSTAYKLTENSSTSEHKVGRASAVSCSSGVVHTISFRAKAAGRSRLRLYVYGFNNYTPFIDLSTKSVVSSTGGTAPTVEFRDSADGYVRVEITDTTTATELQFDGIGLVSTGTTFNYLGDGSSGVLLWGLQREVGAFATSDIPTTSATVTRAADSATMTGSNFSSWFNASAGTFVVEGRIASTAGSRTPVDVANAGSSEQIAIYNSGGSPVGLVKAGGSNVAVMVVGTFAANTAFKASLSYSLNAFAFCFNGGTVATDSLGAVPSGIDRLGIGQRGASVIDLLNAPIARLRYYNTALTNAQLQALTT